MSLIFSEGGIGGVTEEELQKAVDELQSQIDTISAASDCTDIVGTYIDLQNYDTSTLTDNDIIKVLNDTTHNGQPSYYRWSTSTEQFTYIGSEERVNDGTLTIKYGAETVGTFSANQSTNATVNLPSTDLSNYYNKTQTDELLDEKQDKLSPNPPLTITEYTKSNLEGLTYTIDGTGLLSAGVTNNSVAYVCDIGVGGGSVNMSFASSRAMSGSASEQVWSCGYIDIPYNFGQIIGTGKASLNTQLSSNFILGKFVDNVFIPILRLDYPSNSTYPIWGYISTNDTINYGGDNTNRSLWLSSESIVGGAKYSITPSVESDAGRYYGGLCQLIDNNGTITICYGCQAYFATYTFTPASNIYARLKEITTARIVPARKGGAWAEYPLIIDGIGLWNSENPITASTFTTENALGENLFDISGVTKQTYLDLHFGAGLSVDSNGNLVNTNPTPVDVSTKVAGDGVTDIKALTQTEYEALTTPDATTMYVLTDAGAIYLGTILIANNATGGGGIQSTNSIVPTNNRTLGNITSTITETNE